MVYLRTLRNSELMYIFKTLTYGNSLDFENLLTCENLSNLFKNIYNINYTNEEINFTINYLQELSNTSGIMGVSTGVTSGTGDSVGVITDDGRDTVTGVIDFITFANSINNILKMKPLEILLKNTFDNISNGKNYITIDDILNFALKCNIKLSEDSKLKLTSRFSNLNFNQFIQTISST